jgi:hypothetical protein
VVRLRLVAVRVPGRGRGDLWRADGTAPAPLSAARAAHRERESERERKRERERERGSEREGAREREREREGEREKEREKERAAHLGVAPVLHPSDALRGDLGFGRIVALEIEPPNTFAILVLSG